MKRQARIFLAVAIVYFLYVLDANAAAQKFSAKVNGVGIKAVTLDAAYDNFVANQNLSGSRVEESEKGKLRESILEQLISAELLYQESKRSDLGNLQEEIDKQFEGIKKSFASQKEFNDALKKKNISIKDLKEDIKKGVYIKTFLDRKVYNNIVVNDTDKISEYEKNKSQLDIPEQINVSHILIRVKEGATDEEKGALKKKLEDIRKRAVSGEDFSELAKANSEDSSASNGGEIGYYKKGELVKPFEDAAFSLKAGDISDVVETQFGYHIIKLLDKKAPHTLSYEEVEKDIERYLMNRHKLEALNKTVDALRVNAKIEVFESGEKNEK